MSVDKQASEDELESEIENDEEDELPPFLRVSGLSLDLWPAWAPSPSEGTFIPYFSAHVSDGAKESSFVTTISFSDLIHACAQLAHVIRLSSKIAEGLGQGKIVAFSSKDDLIEEMDDICSDIEASLKAIREGNILSTETKELQKPER
jgi:hypothetical protein